MCMIETISERLTTLEEEGKALNKTLTNLMGMSYYCFITIN